RAARRLRSGPVHRGRDRRGPAGGVRLVHGDASVLAGRRRASCKITQLPGCASACFHEVFRWGKDPNAVLAASEALGVGVIVSALLFGFRHGIDWDHIAAITDITSSQEDRGLALEYGTIYALGHALVVFLIGVLAIVLGAKLPDGV